VTRNWRTAISGRSSTSCWSASVACDRSLFRSDQSNSEHRKSQRDAIQIRAIHLSNLQIQVP
jgi:hypothetical protein